jgi:hypothetical protein
MKVDLKRKHPMMKRNQDAEHKNIIHKSFRPAYLFSKTLGVMPLSYTRKKSVTITEACNRNINSMEFEWSWKGAVYSGLWIALLITIRYFIIISRPRPPPRFEADNDHSNSTSENFSNRNTSHPPHFPEGRGHLIGSMNEHLDFVCTFLVLIFGVVAARKIPEIFRHLQDLDENADEDGYVLLGKSNPLY